MLLNELIGDIGIVILVVTLAIFKSRNQFRRDP